MALTETHSQTISSDDTHLSAVQKLADWVSANLTAATPLSEKILNSYAGKDFVFGFHVPHEVTPFLRDFYVFVDERFPYSLPRVYLRDEDLYLKIPHLEDDGYVCVNDERATGDHTNPIGVVKDVINEASKVVENGVLGLNTGDFLSEIHTYWTTKHFYSIGVIEELNGPPRLLPSTNTGGSIYVADDEDTLAQWCKNALTPNQSHFSESDPVIFLALKSDPLPSDYPNTGKELLAFVEKHAEAILKNLHNICEKCPSRIIFIFKLQSTSRPAYISATVERPRETGWLAGTDKRGKRPINGFRPGKVPAKLRTLQYFGANRVARNAPARLDAPWIHGRDMIENFDDIKSKHVVIIGCGSVGSEVAALLAKTGVGNLTLIDNDHMKPENCGRHFLGNEYLLRNKAEAMKAALEKAYPHISQVNAIGGKWPSHYKSNFSDMEKIDLIISATADTATEFALNEWQLKAGRRIPVLYGWTELYAAAGNALLIGKDGPCFACSHDQHGENNAPVTSFDDAQQHIVSQPACGSTFQPYGPIQLGFINIMIANEAVKALTEGVNASYRRAWAADFGFVKTSGGVWGEGWSRLGERYSEGERSALVPCEPMSACSICGLEP